MCHVLGKGFKCIILFSSHNSIRRFIVIFILRRRNGRLLEFKELTKVFYLSLFKYPAAADVPKGLSDTEMTYFPNKSIDKEITSHV